MNTIGIGALVLFEGVGHPKLFPRTMINSTTVCHSSRMWHKLSKHGTFTFTSVFPADMRST